MPGKKRHLRKGTTSAKDKAASAAETEVESTGDRKDDEQGPAKRPKVPSQYYWGVLVDGGGEHKRLDKVMLPWVLIHMHATLYAYRMISLGLTSDTQGVYDEFPLC